MHYRNFIKHRAPVSIKWEELRDTMATHIYGLPPRRLFINRRPLESQNEYALDYRIKNFEPITKQPFLTAINSIAEVAQHVYAPEVNLSPEVWEWIEDNEISVAERKLTLNDFVLSHTAIQAEADPNAAIVVLPVHPRVEFEPKYSAELPNFEEVRDERIDIEIQLIESGRIHFVDDSTLIYEAGDWLYSETDGKEKFQPYLIEISKFETILHIPYKTEKGFEYKEVIYYTNDLDQPPFTIIGNNLVLGFVGGEVVSYRDGTFPGAVAIMNDCLGIKSDSALVDTRFTYPEKIAQYMTCGAGCVKCNDKENPYNGLNVIYDEDGCNVCSKCGGAGTVPPDQTPFGTWLLVKDQMFDADSRFVPPVQFITPPLGSAEYLRKAWQETYSEGKRALFILDQNMTNQSGVSKGYDVRQKVSTTTGAVKNLFRIKDRVLNSISGYFLQDEIVYSELPVDYNIKTSQDITLELAQSVNTSSVYTSELTKQLLLKMFGNDSDSRRAIEFLQLNDRFFGMTIDEIVKTKAIYGNAISPRDQFIHDKGFDILQKIQRNVENFDQLTEEQLIALFNAEVSALFPDVIPQGLI